MNHNRPPEATGTLTLGDIYFVIFRHKWKIILLALAGMVAGVTFYLLNPPLYQSEGRIRSSATSRDSKPMTGPTDNSTQTSDPALAA